ncbi:hypothetical protein A9Q89_04675 [Gammaproteobacteria bacterium 53_120_T64]|nr:hypothetical protein A9Q89_04675 [Gammaproteobacteria bacterium 53_120_T64]
MSRPELNKQPCLLSWHRAPLGSPRLQRGVALILVLWFIVLLGVLALGLSKVSRNGALVARQLSGATQARHLAEGAVQLALANLLVARDEERLLADGEAYSLSFRQGEVELSVWNESGKIDINQADEALLARLFSALDLSPERSAALAGAIADWRDEDELTRLHGAEDEDYFAAGLPAGAGDRAFTHVTELRKVLGMSEAIYQQIASSVTVYSKNQGINPKVAPLLVLLAVSDAEVAGLEHYIKERRRTHRSDLLAPPVPVIEQSYVAQEGGAIFTFSALATTEQGARAGVSRVFELLENEGQTRLKRLDSQDYALSSYTGNGVVERAAQTTEGTDMDVEDK